MLTLRESPHTDLVTGTETARLLAAVGADPAAPLRLAVVAPAGHGKTVLLRALRERWPDSVSGPGEAQPRAVPLLVDNAQLLTDDQCGRLLAFLERGDARIVLAARPWPRSVALQSLLTALTTGTPPLPLPPLSLKQTSRMVGASTGRPPSPAAARFLHACTGGVPEFIERVVDTASAETIERCATQRRLPRDSVERFRADIDCLDESAARLLIAAEAGAGADLAVLGDLLCLTRAELCDVIARARAGALLGRDGMPPPIVSLALRSLGPAERRLDVLAWMVETRLARAQPVLALARMLLGTGATGPTAAAAFEAAAGEAMESDAALSAELYGAAARAGRPVGALAPGWARAAALSGDLDSALRLSDGLLGAPASEARSEGAAIAATVLAHRGELARSAELFQWSARAGSSAFADVGLTATGEPAAAREVVDRTGGDTAPTQFAGAAARMATGVRESVTGSPGAALGPLISAAAMLESAGGATLMPDSPAALAALVGLHGGELTLAETVLARALGGTTGGSLLATRHRLLLAWARMTRGELTDAVARLAPEDRGATELEPRDELFRRALEVGIARRNSDIAGMRRAWRHAYQAVMRHQVDLFVLLPLGELIVVAARLGEHERLARHNTQATELLARLGNPPLWTAMMSWSRLHAAVIAQDREGAQRQADALDAVSEFSGFTEALALAGRGWLAVLGGAPTAGEICGAADRLHALGLRWDAARLAGQAAIRTGDRKAMVMLLEAARGYQGLSRPSRAAPSGEPADPDALATPDVSTLSEREQEVARLVLHGLTYKQIGAQLFISAKTVEHHVARMRGRLGATDRRELLEMLRELLGSTGRGD